MYKVNFSKSAQNYIKKIKNKSLLEEFKIIIDKLERNPHIGTTKTGNLRSVFCVGIKHDGVNYEVAYYIFEEEKIIHIMLAGTREHFYDELKRLLR